MLRALRIIAGLNFLLLNLASISVRAQTNNGIIAGTVLDPTGAAVDGATVTATNSATGQVSTTTVTAGSFRFPSLLIGKYDLSASAPGFSISKQTGVDVQVSSTTAVNFTLQVGDVTQSVTVSAEGTAIQSESSDVGTTVDTHQVIELPLALGGVGAMRSPEAFVFLTPGATGPGTGNSNNGIFISKIGGGQNFGNEILLDGASILRTENGSSFDEAAPSVEAIQEFRVITSTLPAEYDRTTGGIESFTIKNGGNRYHGTVYDIFRNDALDANTWFNNARLAKCAPGDALCHSNNLRPKDKKNDYGVNLGGPVWIPKIYNGKDKTFFFFNWEQYQENRGGTNIANVPTVAERGGDFSEILTTQQIGTNPCNGTPVFQGQIFDPATQNTGPGGIPCRTAFPGNIIPANRISQVSKNFLSYYPQPTGPGTISNFTFSDSNPLFNTTYQIRIDQNFSEKSKVFASYSSRENARYTNTRVFPDPVDPNGWNQDFITHYARVGWDYVFSPTLLNHLNLGYNRTNSINLAPAVTLAAAGNFSWASKLGIRNITNVVGHQFPNVNVGEGVPRLGIGNNDDNIDNGERLNDSVSWTKGKHNLAFGVDLRNQLYSTFASGTDSGVYNFGRAATAAIPSLTSNSGNGIASFLLGQAGSASRYINGHVARWTQPYFAAYVKDDFKLRPNLTLNIGLRWNLDLPRKESHDNTSNFSPVAPNPAANGRLGALVFGDSCKCNAKWADTYYKAWAPRFGFAWTPGLLNNSVVIRGGYGIYYSPMQYTDFGGSQQQGYISTPNLSSVDAFTPRFQWDNGFPDVTLPPNSDPSQTNGQGGTNYIKPEYGRPGMIQSWTLQVQKQLGTSMVGTVGWVGSHATHLRSALENVNNIDPSNFSLGDKLLQPVSNNTAGVGLPYSSFSPTAQVQQALRPFPQYQFINTDTLQNAGQSTYEALQATLERRFSQGISLQASFAWQKNITDADSILPSINGGTQQIQNPRNLKMEKAISIQDIPLVFTVAYLYELPLGKGKRFFNGSNVASLILGGWQVGGVQRYQSGEPIAFGCAQAIPGWDNCIRFDRVPGQSPLSDAVKNDHFDPYASRYFNPAAFMDPNVNRNGGAYRFGNYPRINSDVRMKPYYNEDFSIIRNIRLREVMTVQLKGELLNAFNRHIFARPDTGPNSPNFGLVTGTIDAPRNVQFTVRVNF